MSNISNQYHQYFVPGNISFDHYTTIHHDVTTIKDVLPGGKSRSVPMATLVNCMEGDTPPAEA